MKGRNVLDNVHYQISTDRRRGRKGVRVNRTEREQRGESKRKEQRMGARRGESERKGERGEEERRERREEGARHTERHMSSELLPPTDA